MTNKNETQASTVVASEVCRGGTAISHVVQLYDVAVDVNSLSSDQPEATKRVS
jgi:hypothetical protein